MKTYEIYCISARTGHFSTMLVSAEYLLDAMLVFSNVTPKAGCTDTNSRDFMWGEAEQ